MESGAFTSVAELAAAENINPSYASRVLRLTLRAPDTAEPILDGQQPQSIMLADLLRGVPAGREDQRRRWSL